MSDPQLNPDGVSVKNCTLIYPPKGQAGEYSALAPQFVVDQLKL